ncbi:TetR/AcrR family transcriptional regulator [Actinomycetospora soli]|uniref:TetR/AcrR family transcriptional regulator n=1 Tax=Actinomycetospora soli TaxID=2893887 RepID=UPI001E6179FC|nr:TetR/AcrR family transcriptional regulator [Actinomycetospora soli]MCD2186851.1 TetR/AcrR family transcriptional regulator [Actinomycetospora soli]
MTELSSRPLRADAARNHRAIVAAAREAFEEVGPDVPLEEVARRAGVGPSTLYRRFGGRDELVTAVFAEYFAEAVEPLFARVEAETDPARGIAELVEGIARAFVHRRGILRAAKDAGAFTPEIVLQFVGRLHDLVERAKEQGVVRSDLEARDIPSVAHMLAAIAAPFSSEVDPQVWDRYRAFLLDGLGVDAERTVLPPLEPPPRADVAERLGRTDRSGA